MPNCKQDHTVWAKRFVIFGVYTPKVLGGIYFAGGADTRLYLSQYSPVARTDCTQKVGAGNVVSQTLTIPEYMKQI